MFSTPRFPVLELTTPIDLPPGGRAMEILGTSKRRAPFGINPDPLQLVSCWMSSGDLTEYITSHEQTEPCG